MKLHDRFECGHDALCRHARGRLSPNKRRNAARHGRAELNADAFAVGRPVAQIHQRLGIEIILGNGRPDLRRYSLLVIFLRCLDLFCERHRPARTMAAWMVLSSRWWVSNCASPLLA